MALFFTLLLETGITLQDPTHTHAKGGEPRTPGPPTTCKSQACSLLQRALHRHKEDSAVDPMWSRSQGVSWWWGNSGLHQIRVWGNELRDAGQSPGVFSLTSLM